MLLFSKAFTIKIVSAFYFGGKIMDNGKFIDICKREVAKYANDHLDKTD